MEIKFTLPQIDYFHVFLQNLGIVGLSIAGIGVVNPTGIQFLKNTDF